MNHYIRAIYADGDFAELSVIYRNMGSIRSLIVGSHFFHGSSEWRPIVVGFGNRHTAGLLRQVAQPEQRIGAQRIFRRFRCAGLPDRYLPDSSPHLLRSCFSGRSAQSLPAVFVLAPSHQALRINRIEADVGAIRHADQVAVLFLDRLRYEQPGVEIQNHFAARQLGLCPHQCHQRVYGRAGVVGAVSGFRLLKHVVLHFRHPIIDRTLHLTLTWAACSATLHLGLAPGQDLLEFLFHLRGLVLVLCKRPHHRPIHTPQQCRMIGGQRLENLQPVVDSDNGEIQVLLRRHVENIFQRLPEEPLSLLVQSFKDECNQPHFAHGV